jgi:P4 family phage/plasmid primase-like protien
MTDNVFFTPSLADAFSQAGFEFPIGADTGRITRFSTNNNPHDKAGWINPFPDGKGAVFGCWRSGVSFTWQQRIDGAPMPSGDELKQAKARAAQARKQAEQEREEVYATTAKMLLAEREGLPVATDNHGYVQAKGIKLYGDVRLGQKGQLNIPVYDGNDNLQSVQDVYAPNRLGKSFKQFATDAKMKGGRFTFGELLDGNDITLFEGYATAASGYESGIGACVCCFSGSNLSLVAADLRKRYPNSFIRIGGDFDATSNVSADYARDAEAEAMPNSETVFPFFSDGRNDGDFNDLHQFADLAEVRKQLEKSDSAGSSTAVSNDAGDTNPYPDMREFDAPSLPVVDARDGTTATRPLTEFGNAQRLSDLHGERLRYIPEVMAWLVWREGSWTWDTSGAIVRSLAGGIAKVIYAEGANFDMTQAQYFAKWARTSQSSRSIDAAVSLLSDQGRIRLALAMVDADPMLIGFDHAKQVIDLRTGRVRAATQADYITKSLTPYTIGDAAKAVRWQSFLVQIFNDDAQLIDWLHRWCGYLLTGATSEQIFLFFFGLGANGKSVFAELVKYLMGDYGRSVASETLTETKRQAGGASPDLADLIGCRLAMSSETEDGAALAESLVKSLTSGDSITARKLYCEPVQFQPLFKLLMLGNHRPVIRGNDYGIWRRVRLVPFMRTFSEQERDPNLLDKLKAESPHILAWMVAGCMEWQRRGLGDVPEVVASQTADYRQEQDVIGQWLGECTKSDRTLEVDTSELYTSYRNWAIESGLKPASKVSLGRRLTERGFYGRKSHNRRLWVGLSLNSNNDGGYSYGK